MLRVGILGCGFIGTTFHILAWEKASQAKIVAVCDQEYSRATVVSEKLSAHAYDSFSEMLSNESLDIVDICTPNTLHLNDSMSVGGLLFATFKTPKQWNDYNCSTATDDPWIRKVRLNTDRLNFDICQFFVEDEEDMVNRVSIFKPLHVGYYTMQLRNDESDGPIYHFLVQKNSTFLFFHKSAPSTHLIIFNQYFKINFSSRNWPKNDTHYILGL